MILCKAEHAKAIDKAMFPGTQGGPLEHVIAAKAVSFKEVLDPSFKEYSRQIIANAQALASALSKAGFDIVSGGTDNHLMLVDLRNRGLTGKVAEKALDAAGITVNKNTVPKETQSPFVTSGIRIGTPAVTTRGMKEREMEQIAGLIDRVLRSADDASVAAGITEEVRELTSQLPPLSKRIHVARGSTSVPELAFRDGVMERIRLHESRYDEQAYLFVLSALEFSQSKLDARRHISAAELAHSCRDLALERFGLMSPRRSRAMGNSRDTGSRRNRVHACRARVSGQAADRHAGRIRGVYDFESAFDRDYPWNCGALRLNRAG